MQLNSVKFTLSYFLLVYSACVKGTLIHSQDLTCFLISGLTTVPMWWHTFVVREG